MPLSPQHATLFRDILRCTHHTNLRRGLALHALTLRNSSFFSSSHIGNAILLLYAKSAHLSKVTFVFHSIPTTTRDIVSWNSLINALSKNKTHSSSVFPLFLLMRRTYHAELPDPHNFAGVFSAVANTSDVFAGRQAHALAVKTSCLRDVFVGSSLLNFYSKMGLILDARKVFDRIPERN